MNLSAVIEHTEPNYVRCIKVNDKLVESEFNEIRVEEQLRCGGVLEGENAVSLRLSDELGVRINYGRNSALDQ